MSENDNNDTNNSNLIENTTVNNASYSYNVSQASHVSQINDVAEPIYSCHYCDYTSNRESELIRHSLNAHPNKIAQPDESILKLEKEREV